MDPPPEIPESDGGPSDAEPQSRPAGSGQVPSGASRSRRRDDRRASLAGVFPDADVDAALDALALMDFAWHDCYGDSCPPQSVIDDVVVIASGDLSRLVRAALLGVMDFRDVRVAAHEIQETTG